MTHEQNILKKILHRDELLKQAKQWRDSGKRIVFTNGCFDIIHAGHIASLSEAADEGDVLVVALNSDSSVKNLKGEGRPVNNEEARAIVMASLEMVNAVTFFSEETPRDLIVAIQPDVMVKGGDYRVDQIAGAKEMLTWGGRVVINPIKKGFSTTAIIEKIKHEKE